MLKYKILSILEQNIDRIVTGGELGKYLDVSRTAIWKAIGSLQQEGYEIESFKNSGYKFISDNDVLSEELIRKNLTSKTFGSKIETLKTVDSTNLYIKKQDLSKINEGYVVISNEQTKGRGRFDRCFHSPANEGIYMSLLLKPSRNVTDMQFFTICAALAVCYAIENTCNISPEIKWVNDILYNNKKLCGILTEAVISAETGNIEYIIMGIGINLGQVPEDVTSIATSIYQITNKRGYKNKLIGEILTQLEHLYLLFTKQNKISLILDEYTKRLSILNKKVYVNNFKETYEATVIGITHSGALTVKDCHNNTHTLQSGEVTLRKEV